MYEAHGITLESLVETLNDVRENAEVFNKLGDAIPDYKTRLAAVNALVDLAQVPLTTKISALKDPEEAVPSIEELVAQKRALPLAKEETP